MPPVLLAAAAQVVLLYKTEPRPPVYTLLELLHPALWRVNGLNPEVVETPPTSLTVTSLPVSVERLIN